MSNSEDIELCVEPRATQPHLLQSNSMNKISESTRSRFRVLVTVPVYNEVSILEKSMCTLRKALDASGLDYVLSIFEDGSTDGTKEVLRRIESNDPHILIRSSADKHGRGWALRTQWPDLPFDAFAFCDADLAAGPEALLNAILKVEKGFDLVIGSRYADGARVRRPPARKLVSLAYNLILRMIFRDGIDDHQCGLKAFSRRAVDHVVIASKEDSWFWDTEVIVIAQKLKLLIAIIPVDWTERKSNRTHLLRLLSDLYIHGSGILRLKSDISIRFKQEGMFAVPAYQPNPTELGTAIERQS